MKPFLILLLCLITHSVQAQISGFVTDENSQPLTGARVSLYHTTDSALLYTQLTDSKGYFQLKQQGNSYLLITFNGYQARRIGGPVGNLGQLRLAAQPLQLKQVVIISQQPIVQQKLDRTVITVNSQVRKLADNALDIIRLAPGVNISDNDDAIQLSGKDAIQVMINDKVVKLTGRDLLKLLKAMPAGSVSELEVMNNPSAKYDISGNTGLLNIKTKLNAIRGFTGNTDLAASQGGHTWADLAGLLNYGSDKLAAAAYLAYHYGGYQTEYTKQSNLGNAILNQQNTSLDKWSDPVIRLTLDYYLNGKNTIGGLLEREASTNTGSYQTNSVLNQQETNTMGNNPNVRHWNTYNLNYRYADTLGTGFSFDLDHSTYSKNDESNVTNSQAGSTIYHTFNDITITTFKGDYTHNWNRAFTLEAGFKLSDVQNNSSLTQTDLTQNNNFLYTEKVNSAYGNIGRNGKKWGVQLGLRIEQSRVNGLSTNYKNEQARKPDSAYVSLLPAVYLTWQPGADHSFRLSLNQRIKRPDYDVLQPFTYQVDPYNYQTGNPLLKVQRNTSAELAYTYRDKITLTSSYTHTTDFFNPVILRSGAVSYQSTQNTGAMDAWNFNLNYPVRIAKWWNMLNKLNGFYNRFKGRLYQGVLDTGRWSYMVSTSQRFTLPRQLQLQISARYSSPEQNLIAYQRNSGNVSASISRKLFRDRATFRISFSDIFKMQHSDVLVNFGNLQYTQHNTWESQRVGLAFTWRFGNQKVKQAWERETGNGDEKGRSGK